jgi:hypothetical protein
MEYLGMYSRVIIIDRWAHSMKAIVVGRITKSFHLLESS